MVVPGRTFVLLFRKMVTQQVVALLIAERDKLNRAIEALSGPLKRRGRPPKNPLASLTATAAAPAPAKKKGRRTFTAAQRKAQAAKMKAYWAKRKKASQ
jgi:hypothetical protein